MYSIVGDFIRVGNTIHDPLHSMIVSTHENIVFSMNRAGRKLFMHVWQVIHMADGSPDEVAPVATVRPDEAKKAFLAEERSKVRRFV